jgi:competence protein ComEC
MQMRAALFILLLLVPALPAFAQEGTLKIVFIDVGQGDSTLVVLPNGKAMLIDGGERDQSQAVLSTLQAHGVFRLDAVVATHPHADHIGGLIGVMGSVDVGQVIDSGQVHTTKTFEDYVDAIESRSIPLVPVRDGDTIDLDPSVSMTVLSPDGGLPVGADEEEDFNENSVVIRLDYGEFSAIFPGDIGQETEARLYGDKDVDVDVISAAHHGSRYSSTSPYLQAVTPEVVVIHVGEGNRYGHPHQEALQRIDLAGPLHVFRTDLDGTIVLESDGSDEYTVTTAAGNQTVVVPEFENAAMIAAASLLSIVVLLNKSRVWRSRRA